MWENCFDRSAPKKRGGRLGGQVALPAQSRAWLVRFSIAGGIYMSLMRVQSVFRQEVIRAGKGLSRESLAKADAIRSRMKGLEENKQVDSDEYKKLQGDLEQIYQKEKIVKTSGEIVRELSDFSKFLAGQEEVTPAGFEAAKDFIHGMRARIKLPDIKEFDRARIESSLEKLQNVYLLNL
jgi:hypothetical protein